MGPSSVSLCVPQKDVAWVLREGSLHLRRIGLCPGANALHRKLMRGQVSMRYQPLTDGVVSPAILIRKAHSHEASVGKHNSTLNLVHAGKMRLRGRSPMRWPIEPSPLLSPEWRRVCRKGRRGDRQAFRAGDALQVGIELSEINRK